LYMYQRITTFEPLGWVGPLWGPITVGEQLGP
jgi:hypothetical protein